MLATILFVVGCGERVAPPRDQRPPAAARASAEPVDRFWAWFARDAGRLRAGDLQRTMGEINDALKEAGLDVIAEVEPGEPAWRLVITADGNRDLFRVVERVHAAAPAVAGWAVVAFRQRSPIQGMAIEVDGVKLALDEVRFTAARAGDTLALRVYVPAYSLENDILRLIGFIALDHAVGEKDMETRIGAIEWFAAEDAPPEARPLAELPTVLDRAFAP